MRYFIMPKHGGIGQDAEPAGPMYFAVHSSRSVCSTTCSPVGIVTSHATLTLPGPCHCPAQSLGLVTAFSSASVLGFVTPLKALSASLCYNCDPVR